MLMCMKINLTAIKYTQPLCFLKEGELVCYRSGGVFLIYDKDFCIIKKIKFFSSFIEHVLARIKLVNRFFRLGVRCAIPVSEKSFIACHRNHLYEIDVETGNISCSSFKGIKPLCFSEVKGLKSFKDGIYFGRYISSNPEKKEVCIYRRNKEDDWESVYAFKQGMVNHIHTLVPDKKNDCVWILTGDFDEAAGIWKSTDDFCSVERIVAGNQIYRGCVAYPVDEGLLYATDSQLVQNSIRLLYWDSGEYKSKHICDINGSCIYGTRIGDTFYFATSVEGIGIYKNIWQFLMDRSKGPGIRDYNMYIYAGNLRDGFKIIYSQPKDWLPFSFQFGAFRFPSGLNKSNKLIFQQIATKKNDMSTIILSQI